MQRIFRTKTECSKPTVKVNITKVIAKHYFAQYLHAGTGLMAHTYEFFTDEEIEEAKKTYIRRGNADVLTNVSEFDFKHGYEKYHKKDGDSVERINLIVTKKEIDSMFDVLKVNKYNDYNNHGGIYYCASKVAELLNEYTKTYKKLDPFTFLQDVPMSLRSEILKINQDCLK